MRERLIFDGIGAQQILAHVARLENAACDSRVLERIAIMHRRAHVYKEMKHAKDQRQNNQGAPISVPPIDAFIFRRFFRDRFPNHSEALLTVADALFFQ